MFNRKDSSAPEPKDAGKFALKPALYEPPSGSAGANAASSRAPVAAPAPTRTNEPRSDAALTPGPSAASTPAPAPAPAATPVAAPAAAMTGEFAGSKLFVGINIKLKGVEISDCDNLVIEGHVEATVHSKAMQVEKPGTLTGTALIDVAEIHGQFTGELTARTRLVVHGTGKVSGTIRYGSLVVEQGGELSGDVKQLEAPGAAMATPAPSRPSTPGADAIARRA